MIFCNYEKAEKSIASGKDYKSKVRSLRLCKFRMLYSQSLKWSFWANVSIWDADWVSRPKNYWLWSCWTSKHHRPSKLSETNSYTWVPKSELSLLCVNLTLFIPSMVPNAFFIYRKFWSFSSISSFKGFVWACDLTYSKTSNAYPLLTFTWIPLQSATLSATLTLSLTLTFFVSIIKFLA